MSRPILEQKLAGIRGNRKLIEVYGYLDTGTSHTILGLLYLCKFQYRLTSPTMIAKLVASWTVCALLLFNGSAFARPLGQC